MRTLLLALLLACVPSAASAQTDPPHHAVNRGGKLGLLPAGMPDFCASPDKTSTASGNWNAGGTWVGGVVPAAGDIVRIASGHTVTYNQSSTTEFECVSVASGGTLAFATNLTTKLMTEILLVYGGGTFKMGDALASACIASGNTAELVITDTALDTAGDDPEQFGTGVLFIETAIVRMCGAAKAPTWIRLSEEVSAGETALSVAGGVCPTGWTSGDLLVLPDSRHHRSDYPGLATGAAHLEELTYTSCASGVLTVSAPANAHPGARDMSGTLDFYPHVANQTRNVIIRSENPAGTRGHVMFTDQADVDVRYVNFLDLGRTTSSILNCTQRTTGAVQGVTNSPTCTIGTGAVTHVGTNHIGRYALHIHHLRGPASPQSNGYQYTVIGNAVTHAAPSKWGIAVHASHYGLVQWNTLYDVDGAQIATEDGSESRNVIEYNSAIKGTGDVASGEGWVAAGREGIGFWFRGGNNYVRHNIAANFFTNDVYSAYGYKFYARDVGNVNIPDGPGLDMSNPANYTVTNGNQLPILQFEDNEVYTSDHAITYWWICAADNVAYESCTAGTIKDLVAWHWITRGIYAYPSNGMTIDGYIVRGLDPSTQAGEGAAILAGDYMQRNWVLTNMDIQGYNSGFQGTTMSDEPAAVAPVIPSLATGGTVQTISDSFFWNDVNIYNRSLYTSGSCQQCIPSRITALDNVTFGGGVHIAMVDATGSGANIIQNDRVVVTDYNGTPGDDFTVYYNEAGASEILPQAVVSCCGNVYSLYSTPDSGKTNAQNWTDNGVAWGGEVAPCSDTSNTDIDGIVCAAAAATITNITAVHRAGQTFLTFTEDPAATTYSVYRSTSPITSVSGLTAIATLTQDSGKDLYWTDTGHIIEDDGTPLADDVGLLVWTTASTGTYYYAVTSNVEPTTVSSGDNATGAVSETHQATPGWVRLQAPYLFIGADTHEYMAWEDYSTWNHAEWPYYGHRVNVLVKPSLTPATLYPLVFISHPAGGSYDQGPIHEAPPNAAGSTITSQGVYITMRDSYATSTDPYTGTNRNTSYDIGHYTTSTDRVSLDTENRYRRYIALVRDDPQFQVDPDRIYCEGRSRGGGGCMQPEFRSNERGADDRRRDVQPLRRSGVVGGECHGRAADPLFLRLQRRHRQPEPVSGAVHRP
jgi:hypothetical protein